jgi:DNA polymerase III delta prime subunit
MPHQSLYREYRPKTFKEVVGQEHVVHALERQIKEHAIAHAYLFAGSRGLGKTTIARIFARELGTSERDIYEIDAASNNSVDDIRALTENVYTLPFESKYKVYILDEAHMLSKGAWNAFLKTLEEPPAHAVFILATTELSKVPETVQSRCQVYGLSKPTRKDLANFIIKIGEQVKNDKGETYKVYPDAAELISLLSEGSYRDALSILEKVLVEDKEMHKQMGIEHDVRQDGSRGPFIDRLWVEIWTKAPKRELVELFVSALSEANADKALGAVRKTERESIDMSLYLSLILEQVRLILQVRFAPELRKEIAEEIGPDMYASIEKLAQAKDSKLTHQSLKVLLDATERMRACRL